MAEAEKLDYKSLQEKVLWLFKKQLLVHAVYGSKNAIFRITFLDQSKVQSK
jgi:hypothetical protein